MVDTYRIRTNSFLDSKATDSLMQLVTNEKKERIKRFVHREDALRCLLGDLLSRYALGKRTGLKNSELKFMVNEYNKPLLVAPEHLHFNVSHSGNWAVCAVADKLVGIDVEYVKNIDLKIAERFFTNYEYDSLVKQDPKNRIRYFYTLWTLKESYIKADGRGLSLPLDSFSIEINNDSISVITDNELKSCFFEMYEIDNFHISSVCSLDSSFNTTLKEVTYFDLLQALA
ncbi:4'-phosphopantetheinyl transferase family protein [Ruminiclostridium cellobioparum]|uniref:4'-phosphopantetheinyl transferase family protein n=1 Tax=Ruminiclostridium cellobioparum TaxID=29355 RepID=UPI0028B0F044|nr:4'-phosphopantetheinyl transferase superfamily protein [Ruminiclostridium cellobioparum]